MNSCTFNGDINDKINLKENLMTTHLQVSLND